MLQQTIKEEVRVKLTEKEIRKTAENLARRIEDEKKSVVSELTAKINEANAAINYLARTHSTGYEMRMVACEIEYDLANRTRTIINPKTGETVATRPLETWEIEELRQPSLPGV